MSGETRVTAAADWETLGLEPTGDVEAVKRAYRARLRDAGPDRDPEAFQRLRAAYEAIIAAIGTPPTGHAPSDRTDDPHAASAEAFVLRLVAFRAAGDEAGAMAAVDAEVARHAPGSDSLAALEEEVLAGTALSRNLSPGLFRHIVRRFDWTDANSRAARADPERHALLTDRLAAEDWYEGLRDGEDRIGRALVSTPERAREHLPFGPLDPAAKSRVRELFGELDAHAMFVLHRFDARTLAMLREAVEGPPIVAAPPPPPPPDPTKRRTLTVGAGIGIAVLAGLIGGLAAAFRTSTPPASPGTAPITGSGPPVAATEARRLLADPRQAYVSLEVEPGGVLVSFAPIAALRAGVSELRIGSNREEPDTPMVLPPSGVVPRWPAPEGLRFLTLRVRTDDGTWLPTRRYDMPPVVPPRPQPASPLVKG